MMAALGLLIFLGVGSLGLAVAGLLFAGAGHGPDWAPWLWLLGLVGLTLTAVATVALVASRRGRGH